MIYIYPCALCDRIMSTRYGFRAHMKHRHGYRSTGHARPGRGLGKGHPMRLYIRAGLRERGSRRVGI